MNMADNDIFYEGKEVIHYDAEGDKPAEDYNARTTCCLRKLVDDFYAKGMSICGRDDTFDEEFGKRQAKSKMNAAVKRFNKYKPTKENYQEFNKHITSQILVGGDLDDLEVKLLAENNTALRVPEEMPSE